MAVMAIENSQWKSQANEVSSYFTVIRDLVFRAHEEVSRHHAISKSCQTLDTTNKIIQIARLKAEECAASLAETPFPVELEAITNLAERVLIREFEEILHILKETKTHWFTQHKHNQFTRKVIENREALLDLIRYLKQFHRADAWDLQFCQMAHDTPLGEMLSENSVTISADDWHVFVEALENPPKPTQHLQDAVKTYRQRLAA